MMPAKWLLNACSSSLSSSSICTQSVFGVLERVLGQPVPSGVTALFSKISEEGQTAAVGVIEHSVAKHGAEPARRALAQFNTRLDEGYEVRAPVPFLRSRLEEHERIVAGEQCDEARYAEDERLRLVRRSLTSIEGKEGADD